MIVQFQSVLYKKVLSSLIIFLFQITITDNDLIEKSNLNRQFLFRSHHIQVQLYLGYNLQLIYNYTPDFLMRIKKVLLVGQFV